MGTKIVSFIEYCNNKRKITSPSPQPEGWGVKNVTSFEKIFVLFASLGISHSIANNRVLRKIPHFTSFRMERSGMRNLLMRQKKWTKKNKCKWRLVCAIYLHNPELRFTCKGLSKLYASRRISCDTKACKNQIVSLFHNNFWLGTNNKNARRFFNPRAFFC